MRSASTSCAPCDGRGRGLPSSRSNCARSSSALAIINRASGRSKPCVTAPGKSSASLRGPCRWNAANKRRHGTEASIHDNTRLANAFRAVQSACTIRYHVGMVRPERRVHLGTTARNGSVPVAGHREVPVARHTPKIIVKPCAGKQHARFERGN